MSAIFIWLGIPFLVAILAFFLRRIPDVAYPLVLLICLLLIGLSFFVTIDAPIALGESTIKINSSTIFLGRLISIGEEEIGFVNLVYFLTFLWMFLAWRVQPNRFFPGLGLMAVVALLSAVFIQPSFYAGFIFQFVVFMFVPLWVKAGAVPSRGVYRFLLMMTFGLPFIFLAGWQFSTIQLGLDNSLPILYGGILLSLGVFVYFSAFPIHSWIPMLSEKAHPMILGFFMSFFPFIVIRFFYVQVFTYEILDVVGEEFGFIWILIASISMGIGGFGMMVARKFVRFQAYYLIFSSGVGILVMALFKQESYSLVNTWWFVSSLGVIIFLFALHKTGVKDFSRFTIDLHDADTNFSRHVGYLLLTILPMLMFPFTMGFPVFLEILRQVSVVSVLGASTMIFGIMGGFVFVLRLAVNLTPRLDLKNFGLSFRNHEKNPLGDDIVQNRWVVVLLGVYFLIQIILGVFPVIIDKIGFLS